MSDDSKAIVVARGSAPVATDSTSGPKLVRLGVHHGDAGDFEIYGNIGSDGKPGPLLSASDFEIFVAKAPTGQMVLMQTTKNVAVLHRVTDVLRIMQEEASDIDASRAAGIAPYNYGAHFPAVLEYVEPDDDKAVFIMGYHPSIATYEQLIPASVALSGKRVDLQTATWMLGKLLKFVGFVHSFNLGVGRIDATNVFLETEQHGVFIPNWFWVNTSPTEGEKIAEVAQVAKYVWQAAGGTDATEPPHDLTILSAENHAEYVAFLRRLMDGDTEGADAEQPVVYQMADRFWEKVPNVEGTGMKRPWHEWATTDR